MCTVSVATVSDFTHPNSAFLGRLRTTCYRQGNKRVAERLWTGIKAERLHFEQLSLPFDTTHCYDRNAVCLKDLTFLFITFIRQHQLWNEAYLRVAVITASAGRLMQKHCFLILRFS